MFSDQEILLLQAALLKRPYAERALNTLNLSVENIESLTPGVFRILPLLYKNIIQHGFDLEITPKLKGIYNYTWAYNHRLISNLPEVLAALSEFRPILFKGAGLLIEGCLGFGHRPMQDIDILVPKRNFEEALLRLEDLGIVPDIPNYIEFISFIHAIGLKDKNERQYDLHKEILPINLDTDVSRSLWDNTVSVKYQGEETLILGPTDHFFQICVHGSLMNRISPIRWVGDAFAVLQKNQFEIDWDRFIHLTENYKYHLFANSALVFLKQHLFVDIPVFVFEVLENKNVSFWEAAEFTLTGKSIPVFWDGLSKIFYFKRINTDQKNFIGKGFAFIRFLQFSWGIEKVWKVPFMITALLFRRIWIDIFRPPYFVRKKYSATLK